MVGQPHRTGTIPRPGNESAADRQRRSNESAGVPRKSRRGLRYRGQLPPIPMFLIACTPHRFEPDLPGLEMRVLEGPGCWISFAHASQFSRYDEDPAGFSYTLSPLGPHETDPEAADTAIRFDRASETLRIATKAAAGSSVYHYSDLEGQFFCASSVGLLGAAGVPLAENDEAMPGFFLYRCVTPPATLYQGVTQLAKGSMEIALGSGCRIRSRTLHPLFPDEAAPLEDEDAVVDGILEILEASFSRLDRSRQQVAVPLSGGMDSSVLFRLAQRSWGLRESCSAGYPFEPDESNHERRYALRAARAFGVEHHYFTCTNEEYLEAVIRATAACEEPIHHHQAAMFYLLWRDILPEQAIVVNGHGSGGLFGTALQIRMRDYETHPAFFGTLSSPPLRQALEWISRATGRGRRLVKTLDLRGRLALPAADPHSLIWPIDSYGKPDWIMERFGVPASAMYRSRAALLDAYAGRGLHELMVVIESFDKTQYLWGQQLRALGRFASFPLMEQRLLHHVFRAPLALRLGKEKHLLAQAARRLGVPEVILRQKKSGFGIRRPDWALPGGVFDPLIPLAAKVVDEREIRALQTLRLDEAMTFWCVLSYALWRRLCIDREPVENLVAELHGGRA
jgi:hypothetical protein